MLEDEKMSVRTLPRASAKALERARRMWPEARAEDFEKATKYHWRDKATGNLFRRVPGDPQAGGVAKDIDVWFLSGDELGDGIVYLLAADAPGSVVSSKVGSIGGYAEGRGAMSRRRVISVGNRADYPRELWGPRDYEAGSGSSTQLASR